MVSNPPEGFPQVTPYLLYEDVDAIVDWLVDVFGFTERYRMPGPDGKAQHAELQMGTGVVMMGNPGPDYKNPKHQGGVLPSSSSSTSTTSTSTMSGPCPREPTSFAPWPTSSTATGSTASKTPRATTGSSPST